MDAQVCIEPGNAGPIHIVLGEPGVPYLEMWGTRHNTLWARHVLSL
jgi:hypothetical protein